MERNTVALTHHLKTAVSTLGVAALAAAGVCASGIYLYQKHIAQPAPVQIDRAAFVWLQDVRFGFAQPGELADYPRPLAPGKEVAKTQLRKPIQAKKVKPVTAIATRSQKVKKKVRVRKQVVKLAPQVTKDQIRQVQARPVKQPAQASNARLEEQLKMRAIHQIFRRRFIQAVNTQNQPRTRLVKNTKKQREPVRKKVDTQKGAAVAPTAPIQVAEEENQALDLMEKTSKKSLQAQNEPEAALFARLALGLTKASPLVGTLDLDRTKETGYSKPRNQVEKPKKLTPSQIAQADIQRYQLRQRLIEEDILKRKQAAVLTGQLRENPNLDLNTQKESNKDGYSVSTQVAGNDLSIQTQSPGNTQEQVDLANPAQGESVAKSSQSKQSKTLTPAQILGKRIDFILNATQAKVDRGPRAEVVSKPRARSKAQSPAPSKPIPVVIDSRPEGADIVSKSQAAVVITPSQAQVESDRPRYVEAFDWVQTVEQAKAATLAYEGRRGQTEGHRWIRAKAPGYWPTITVWQKGSKTQRPIPMMNENSAQFLAKLAKIDRIEAAASVVFGKLPKGWSIDISGRSETVILLDAKNNRVEPSQVHRAEYFAYFNVVPGSHLIYLQNIDTGAVASVVTPSLTGTATYMDLSQPKEANIWGHVVSSEAVGLDDVKVSVVGQSQTAVSNRDGFFLMENITVFPGMPVYLETEIQNQFVYRYRLDQSEFKQAVLFRMSDVEVQNLIAESGESVSRDSGLVVGAFPKMAKENDQKSFNPSVKSLINRSPLRPVVEVLSANGEVIKNRGLGLDRTRVLGVQISEGPAVIRLRGKSGTEWSQVFHASPGIVNMIGPY